MKLSCTKCVALHVRNKCLPDDVGEVRINTLYDCVIVIVSSQLPEARDVIGLYEEDLWTCKVRPNSLQRDTN